MTVPEAQAWQAWTLAARTAEVVGPLSRSLEQIDRQAAASGFACQQSGRCCKFESFGHRLYMSGLEIAWFKLQAGNPPGPMRSGGISLPQLDAKQDGCPYKVDGLCGVHKVRPFACRVFFCQEGSDTWQSQQYEAHQQRIRKLHDDLGLPYRYMEWRQGLADAAEHGL